MKRYFITFILIACSLSENTFGQNNALLKKINLLSRVSNIPFDSCLLMDKDCGDELIWEIASYGKAAINPLINKILDTTYSNFHFPLADGKSIRLRTGDIAYITLIQIIPFQDLPRRNEFDQHICGGYETDLYTYYLPNFSYRSEFQKKIKEAYTQQKLKWIPTSKNELTPCEIEHGIKGHYRDWHWVH